MKMHPRKPIALIAALDEENAIGRNGDLLCYLPNDLKHFKQITQGHRVIMGRRTYESLPKGALPNRTNIVITSDQAENYPGCIVVRSLEGALDHCLEDETAFVIGGGCHATLPAETLHHPHPPYLPDADTFFPEITAAAETTTKNIMRQMRNILSLYLHNLCEARMIIKPQTTPQAETTLIDPLRETHG